MNEVVHTSPTIGSNVEEIVVNNTRFLMWDIGGQESLRSSWNTYYTNTEVRAQALPSGLWERMAAQKERAYRTMARSQGAALHALSVVQQLQGACVVQQPASQSQLPSVLS